jgi:hypothetical protein
MRPNTRCDNYLRAAHKNRDSCKCKQIKRFRILRVLPAKLDTGAAKGDSSLATTPVVG